MQKDYGEYKDDKEGDVEESRKGAHAQQEIGYTYGRNSQSAHASPVPLPLDHFRNSPGEEWGKGKYLRKA